MMNAWDRFKNRYERFMEAQGFYWLCALCALVIVFTALWTANTLPGEVRPPAAPAEASLEESLKEVRQRPTLPEPTQPPLLFSPPVQGKVTRGFSLSTPVYFEHTGHWQLHGGVDYALTAGTVVKAVADGTVLNCTDSEVVITHDRGYESRYSGLAAAPYVRTGDPVQKGQTIGHSGQGPLWEQGEGPHLHLEIRRDGRPADPLALFE